MSSVGYNAYYTLPNSSTQWRIDMSQLDLGQRWAVERALNDPGSTVYWNELQAIQEANPGAFQEVKNGSGPLRAPALSTQWYFDPSSVDINFLIGFVVDLIIDIGASMSKQSMADAYGDIAQYRALAEKRLKEELEAAKSEFAGAIANAAMGMVSGAVSVGGGGWSMKLAKGDYTKMDDLGKTKMDLTERKDAYNESAEQLEFHSQSFTAKAKEHEFNAATARSKAKELNDAADVKQKEVNDLLDLQTDQNHMATLDNAGKAKLAADIQQKTDETVQLRNDAKAQAAEADKQDMLAADNARCASHFEALAKGMRLEATKEGIELGLTKVGIDERKLDARTQQHGNMTRLISVIAPLFTSIGGFINAFFQLDSKTQTAYANFITSEMELTQMLKGIEDEIVKNFKELINEAIQFQKAIDESNNQTMANIAQKIA